MNTLIPTIKWSQNSEYVIVNLEINQVKNDVYEINNNNIVFSGVSNTDLKYGINLELLNTVNKDESKYIVEERVVRFILKKTSDEKWIRLTKDKNQYKSNIKVNWDSFEDSDEEQELSEKNIQQNQQFDFSSMMNMGNNGFNMEEMMKNMDPDQMEQLMKSMNMGGGDDEDNNSEDDNNNNEEYEDKELEGELDNIINNDDNESIDSDDLCQECCSP